MKKHKQTKKHIENAKDHGVPSSWWFKNAIDAAVEAKQAELRKLKNAIDTAVKVKQAQLRKRKRDD